MSTITAVASDGINLVYFEGDGLGTASSPFKPKHVLADGAATTAKQDEILSALNNIDTSLESLTVETGLTPLTNAELRATPVPVTGTITLDSTSLTALENITVTVGAAVEINNDVGNPIPVSATTLPLPSGAATASNQTVIIGHIDGIETLLAGTLTVSTGLTPLTDAQLRATPVPVSGTVNADTGLSQPLTVTELNSTTVSVANYSSFLRLRNPALTNTAVAIKANGGEIMGVNFINPNTTAVYVKVYDAVHTSVTVGTTAVVATFLVPHGDASGPGVFYHAPTLTPMLALSNAISVSAVSGLADNSSTAPTTPIHAEVSYQ